MRKILLGTTALLAAGALYAADAQAANPINVGVKGFMTQRFGYGTTDISGTPTQDYDGFDVKQDAEIHFTGSTTLDNGIMIGVVVELEAGGSGGSSSVSGNQTPSDQIDEEYLYINGSFGRIVIGSENTAAYQMAYRHASAAGNLSTNEGTNTRWIRVPGGFTLQDNTNPLASNDRDQISYYTPRWSGFQIGASYIPTASEPQFVVVNPDANAVNLRDGLSAAINYDNKFGDLRIQAAAVFEQHQGGVPNSDDDTRWGLSTIITYAGFSAGVSYLDVDYDGVSPAAASATGEVWYLGLGYRFGATYITGTYTAGEAEGNQAVSGDDETTAWMVAVSHVIGPGIDVHGAVFGADYDNETGGTDTDGWGAVVGVTTRF